MKFSFFPDLELWLFWFPLCDIQSNLACDQAPIISAAERAFLCRREEWRRVGERFAGIWQTSNIPLAGLLFQRTQTLSRAKKRSCSFWKIEFAKLLDSSVLKAELNCPFCKVFNGWNLFTSQMDQNPTQIGLAFLYWSATYALLAPVVGCIGDKTVSFLFGKVIKTSFCEFFCDRWGQGGVSSALWSA